MAFEKARKALKRGDPATAYTLVTRALDIEPGESRFHCLLGDILAKRGRKQSALAAYCDALRLDPHYFRNYYQRGRLWMELGHRRRARRDLEQSLALLPTADGNYTLGRLLIQQNDRRRAVELFRAAAGSRSRAGQAALQALYRYDLPDHPGRYLKTRLERHRGCFRVVIRNPTSVAVTALRVRVQRSKKQYFEFTVNRVIPSGGRLQAQTQVKVADKKELYKWRPSIMEVVPAGPPRADALKRL